MKNEEKRKRRVMSENCERKSNEWSERDYKKWKDSKRWKDRKMNNENKKSRGKMRNGSQSHATFHHALQLDGRRENDSNLCRDPT